MGEYDKDVVAEAAGELEVRQMGEHSLMTKESIMDPDNERSLYNIAPKGVADLIDNLNEKWLHISERELKELVGSDPALNRVRIAFWKEYDVAQEEYRAMTWANITRMVQCPSYALSDYFKSDATLAYILCPPVSYDAFLEEALSHGMSRIREILDLDLVDAKGNVNWRVGDLILKAAAFLDMRVHGGFLQKSMNTNANINATVGLDSVQRLAKQLSMDEIDEKIRQLESGGDAVDVE